MLGIIVYFTLIITIANVISDIVERSHLMRGRLINGASVFIYAFISEISITLTIIYFLI